VWHERPVDVAVPAGTSPHHKALAWLKSFSAANARPLLYRIDEEWYAFGPPAFQTDMRARIDKGERPWD